MKASWRVELGLLGEAGSGLDGKTYTGVRRDLYNGSTIQNLYSIGNRHKSSFKEELRYSAGAAVTWMSPLGPMKFSYAYPMKKKASDEVQRFQFQLGTTF